MDNTSKLNLLKLLNEENALPDADKVLPEEVEFSAPEVVSVNGCDTKIVATTLIRGDNSEPLDVFYHRRPLPEYLPEDLAFEHDDVVNNSHDVLGLIAEEYDVVLPASDIVPTTPEGDTLLIKAEDGSYEWRGEREATLFIPVSLKDVITVTKLDGLLYPDHQNPAVGQAQVYSFNIDCSFIGYFLDVLIPGIALDDSAMAVSLSSCATETWVASDTPCPYNLRGSEVVFEGTPAELDWGNEAYERVVGIRLGPLCTNIQGVLNLHYNITPKEVD